MIVVATVGAIATAGVAYSYSQTEYRPCERVQQIAGIDDFSSNKAYALLASYPDLKTLVRESDAIAVGKVRDCVGIRDSSGLPFTYFDVATEKIVKTSDDAKIDLGDKITIQLLMSGEDADDHIKVGDRYVFFMGYSKEKELYAPLGPQGRFIVDNQNLVYSLNVYYPDVNFLQVKENGVPLHDFISEIENAELE